MSWLSMQNSLDLRGNFDNQRLSPTMTHWILPVEGNFAFYSMAIPEEPLEPHTYIQPCNMTPFDIS